MSLTEITGRQIGRRAASAPGRVTGRLKRTLDLMAYEPMTDSQACGQTGMRLMSLRIALRQPHVQSYWRAQLQVLRARENAMNIHRLTKIRDAANNMPAVQAIRMLEQLGDDNPSMVNGLPRTGGLTVVVIQPGASRPPDPQSGGNGPQVIDLTADRVK